MQSISTTTGNKIEIHFEKRSHAQMEKDLISVLDFKQRKGSKEWLKKEARNAVSLKQMVLRLI